MRQASDLSRQLKDLPFTAIAQRQRAGGALQLLRHIPSGAQVVIAQEGQVQEEAAESCCSISLRTPAQDDTGLSHVLEHLVFRGSVARPLDQLYTAIKSGSLVSHLNASTRALHSSFHIANPIAADAPRLEAILLDAIFRPLLREQSLVQESCYAGENGPAGVVFNEMSGHFASAIASVEQALLAELFRNHPQGWAYGGTPHGLTQLDPAALRAYHQRQYHPANCLIYLTGSADLQARLAAIDATFQKINRSDQGAFAHPFPPFSAAITRTIPHPRRAYGCGWRMQALHPLEMQLLSYLLRQYDPQLSGQSGVQIDGELPALLLLSDRPIMQDLQDFAQSLNVFKVEAGLKAIASQFRDGLLDPHLPQGLQGRAALLGAWMRHEDLLAAIDVEGEIAKLRATLPAVTARLQTCLQRLHRAPRVELCTDPSLPIPPLPPVSCPLPQAEPLCEKPLPMLALNLLPQKLPSNAVTHERGISILQPKDKSDRRLLVLFDATGLPPSYAAQLPHLAQALAKDLPQGSRIDCRCGDIPALSFYLDLEDHPAPAWLFHLAKAPLLDLGAYMPKSPPILAKPQYALELRLRAGLSDHAQAVDALAGIGRFLVQVKPDAMAQRALARALFHQTRFRAAVMGAEGRAIAEAIFAGLAGDSLPALPQAAPSVPWQDEAITAPLSLYAQGVAAKLPEVAQGPLLVALKAIETHRLWPKLRQSGGAYGVRAMLSPGHLISFISVRDPQCQASLAVMRQSARWLATHLTTEMLEQARRQALAALFAPRTRWQALELALGAGLRWRDPDLAEILGLNLNTLRIQLALIDERLQHARAVVMADAPSLAHLGPEFTRRLPQWPL